MLIQGQANFAAAPRSARGAHPARAACVRAALVPRAHPQRSWANLLGAAVLLLTLAACAFSQPSARANRPDGEGYAGVGELLVRIRVLDDGAGWLEPLMPRRSERASVEIRYLGLSSSGRAVFERHDVDLLAGAPAPARSAPSAFDADSDAAAPLSPADTRQILLDLRLARQIRVQGKVIEILEASASGVVFRLY